MSNELLRTLDKLIYSPYIANPLEGSQLEDLLKLARETKVSFYLLERLFESKINLSSVELKLAEYESRYSKMINLMVETDRIFKNNNVNYVIFKTLKPFPAVGSDIDVLIFGRSLNETLPLIPFEFELMDMCQDNATLYCPTFGTKLDLHTALSVSLFPYWNAEGLKREVVEKTVNGTAINVLTSEAEVIITACHSIFKEQMITLQDCYIFQELLPLCNLNRIKNLLKQNHTSISCFISIFLSQYILSVIRGKTMKSEYLDDAGLVGDVARYEIKKFIRSGCRLPYKYSAYALLLSFTERALLSREGQIGASYIARQLFNKKFVRRLADRLPAHLNRTTY